MPTNAESLAAWQATETAVQNGQKTKSPNGVEVELADAAEIRRNIKKYQRAADEDSRSAAGAPGGPRNSLADLSG